MSRKNRARIQDVLGALNAFCPPALAEEWDNVGLQVGDPAAEVSRVAVALDPTAATLEEAVAADAGLLVCHHPLIFKPLRQVTPNDETGRIVSRAIQAGVAVIAVHTNLDRARGGLNDWLAERLGLPGGEPLETPEGLLFKLTVFVPAGHEETVADALFAGGAGQIGAYDRCSFRIPGTGTFRPGEGTDPFIGAPGEAETVSEIRLETIVPKERLGRVVARLLKAHPYEEVAYDLYPLVNRRTDIGLGRIARLPAPERLDAYAARVRSALCARHVRMVGDPGQMVSKVAVCGGSGASLLATAARQGADVLVTGDVKYHEARIAESQGLALIDAGHFATENIMIESLTGRLREMLREQGFDIEVLPLSGEQDPFTVI